MSTDRGESHRGDDPIVELARYPSQFEADAVAGILAGYGIRASVVGDGAGGWLPQAASAIGAQVLVFESELDAARELLDAPTEAPD